MQLEKANFSVEHIPDNDAAYFSLLEGAVNSVDPYSTMSVMRGPRGYSFRICPSASEYINVLIEQLVALNKFMGIMLNFSKSMKSTSVLSFDITIFAEQKTSIRI